MSTNKKLVAIVAATKLGIIGLKGANELLWTCPEDLTHFKDYTEYGSCITGYNTYLSLLEAFKVPYSETLSSGHVLPNRICIVIADSKRTPYPDNNPVTSVQLLSLFEDPNFAGCTIFVPNMVDAVLAATMVDEALEGAPQLRAKFWADQRKDPKRNVKAYIIGGAAVYQQALRHHFVEEVIVSIINIPSESLKIGSNEVVKFPDIGDEYDLVDTLKSMSDAQVRIASTGERMETGLGIYRYVHNATIAEEMNNV